MNKQDISELAYKNGYTQGIKDFAEILKEKLDSADMIILIQEGIDPYTGKEGLIYGYEQRATIETIEEICKTI